MYCGQSQVECFPWLTAMCFHTLLWESQGVQSPRGSFWIGETLRWVVTGCQHWDPENLSPGWLPSTVFLCLKVSAGSRPTVCRICLREKNGVWVLTLHFYGFTYYLWKFFPYLFSEVVGSQKGFFKGRPKIQSRVHLKHKCFRIMFTTFGDFWLVICCNFFSLSHILVWDVILVLWKPKDYCSYGKQSLRMTVF